MKIFKWVAMAALVSTTPALAADFEAAEPFSWTGLYVGAYAGYAWGDGMLDNTFCRLNNCGGTYFVEPDVDGFIGGGLIGYNQQFSGGFVFGAEMDLGIGPSGDGVFEGTNVGLPLDPNYTGEIDVGLSGSARLRAGFAIDHFMPFITGGVAFASYDADIQGPGGASDVDTRSGDGSLVGWTVGGGLNYALTDNIILGAEYRYTDFGSDTVGLTNPLSDTDIWAHEVELQTHDLRVTASFKF